MARPVKDLQLTRRHNYPWDKWFDGKVWELTPGKDFSGSVGGFRGSVYAAAKARGIKAVTHLENDKVFVQKVE